MTWNELKAKVDSWLLQVDLTGDVEVGYIDTSRDVDAAHPWYDGDLKQLNID